MDTLTYALIIVFVIVFVPGIASILDMFFKFDTPKTKSDFQYKL